MSHNKLNIYEKTDALVLEMLSIIGDIKYHYDRIRGKLFYLSKNIDLKDRHLGQRCFILGNAPSLNEHDLTRLANEVVFMVNRSFQHPSYEAIAPTYHVFVDPKLANGQWPVAYLDELIEKNPRVTLLLKAEWFHLEIFSRFKRKVPIYWLNSRPLNPLYVPKSQIDLTKRSSSYFVVEQAITAAMYMGVKQIYLLGYEGNGIAHLLTHNDTHFNGKDPDYDDSTPFELARAMHYNARFIRVLYTLTSYAEQNNIDLCNLTPQGIITMMRQDSFDNIFPSS